MRLSYHDAAGPLRALAVVASLALGACSGDGNIVRDAAIASGMTGGEPKPPPDFISRSRVTGADYIPVGTDAPRRRLPAKAAAEVGAAETEMDAVRQRNEMRGARARRDAAQ